MENKKATPFTEGNQWRFQEGNLSAKRVTRKQLIRQVEGLLAATSLELTRITVDESNSCAVRKLADSILTGNPIYVAEFLSKLVSYEEEIRRKARKED